MANRSGNVTNKGFSLVEMLVAVVFTMILMGGMAFVFRSSLQTFYSSGEKLSSIRRNRVSLGLLYDDLNMACMYLSDIAYGYQNIGTDNDDNPPFYIVPNAPIAGAVAGLDPLTTDQLYFFVDHPLPFEGILSSGGQTTASDAVLTGRSDKPEDNIYKIDCKKTVYASAIASLISKGTTVNFHIKDEVQFPYVIQSVTQNEAELTVVTKPEDNSMTTGRGDTGALRREPKVIGSYVAFFIPRQMIRYEIRLMNLDPQRADSTPCLVKERGVYSKSGIFVPDPDQTEIVSENVSGFKAYLSANAGRDWAGIGVTGNDKETGWNNGILPQLNTQLMTAGRTDFKTTQGKKDWFRDIPVLVRLDVTTRSAIKRTDFSATASSAAHHEFTQSMILTPRHSGLAMSIAQN